MTLDFEFRYCPVCGGGLQSRVLKEHEPARLLCPACGFILYLDPKLVACAVVEYDGKIVLGKRSIMPELGKWTLPGGYVDRGETVESAVHRETLEECGVEIRITGLLGVYSITGDPSVVVVYVSRYASGELRARDETQEVGLFREEDIPWDCLAFAKTTLALKDYFRLRSGKRPSPE